MTHACRLHGLDVVSPFALGHPVAETRRSDARPPDLRITVDDARTTVDPDAAPPGRLVVACIPGQPHYALFDRGADGYQYRLHHFVEIDISPDLREVHCRLDGAAAEGLLPVILAGHVVATLLLLRGELVFHASAVEVDGRAVAFVGNSGAGKSTLAAAACRQGARLVADDVLRVTWEGAAGAAACYRGAASLRLRPGSKALAGERNGTADTISTDGRHLVMPEPTPLDVLPLAAVFIPRLREPDHPLLRTALDPRSALFALLQYPRVQNWTDPKTSALHFDKLATLVQEVPVYFLDVPWGVPTEESCFEQFADLVLDRDEGVGIPNRQDIGAHGPLPPGRMSGRPHQG